MIAEIKSAWDDIAADGDLDTFMNDGLKSGEFSFHVVLTNVEGRYAIAAPLVTECGLSDVRGYVRYSDRDAGNRGSRRVIDRTQNRRCRGLRGQRTQKYECDNDSGRFPHAEKVRRLKMLGGVGETTATVLVAEVYHRSFETRRHVASFVGLAPSPYKSGDTDRDRGISKAGTKLASVAPATAAELLASPHDQKVSLLRDRLGEVLKDRPLNRARVGVSVMDAQTGEVLNLLARRNLLFQIIKGPDPKYDLNVQSPGQRTNLHSFCDQWRYRTCRGHANAICAHQFVN